MTESAFLVRYEAAKAALEEAVQVDEVLDIHDAALKLRAYGKIAKDRRLQANAAIIVIRAERKLGVLLTSAKETGQLGIGRPEKSNVSPLHDLKEKHVPPEENGSSEEPISRVTLKEAGIDKKLSMRSQRWAQMGEPEFEAKLQAERDRIESIGAQKAGSSRTVMAGRVESPDSLDYFPTPPWATRALVEDVLPYLGAQLQGFTIWEPACGEGHISGVLQQYGLDVDATDVFDYSQDGRSPPGWTGTCDFLNEDLLAEHGASWIITNPPFGDLSLQFALRAIERAEIGVALFLRTQWLEGVDRYEKLFRDNPPTLFAQFAERVNLCKGRWDPEGSTASQYCWLVWIKDAAPRAPFWIPPGRRIERALPDDIERFTAKPVLPIRPDEPADTLDDPPLTGVERSQFDAPEGAAAEGEGGAPTALPHADIAPDALTVEQQNDILRAGYACAPKLSITELMLATGLKRSTVKMRVIRLGLADPENQRTAARAAAHATNAKRRGET